MSAILVLGGARSGKSQFAVRLAEHKAQAMKLPVTFVATGQPLDEEMSDRIARHQSERPSEWTTVEEPRAVALWLEQPRAPEIVVIDCLTLLLNNWMFLDRYQESDYLRETRRLTEALQRFPGLAIVVSNEIGLGLVPGDPLSRRYRDWLGILNQSVAAIADPVYMLFAGIPVDLKRMGVHWQ